MTTAIRQAEPSTALLIPIGALIVAMLSFTSGASVAKQLFPIVGPQGTTALRLSIGALILIAVLRPWRVRLTATSWRSIVFYGLAMGGMNLLFYMSIQRLPLGIAIALEFTGPLTVAILSSRRKIDLLWVALAAGGLSLLLPVAGSIANVDPVGALLAKTLLRREGCTVQTAADGHEALDAMAAARFDLVFMDMRMPHLDGPGAARALRARGDRTPIIALTANAFAEDRERCYMAGMDDYLAKPFEARQLHDVLLRWMPQLVENASPAA